MTLKINLQWKNQFLEITLCFIKSIYYMSKNKISSLQKYIWLDQKLTTESA